MRPLLLASLLLPLLLPALTLDEALDAALRDHPDRDAAAARLEQALARMRQARAAYHPRLQLEARGAHTRLSDAEAQRIPGAPDSLEQYTAGLRATWLLFDGGERRGRLDAASHRSDAAAASQNLVRRELAAAVARTFHAAQNARESVRIAQADEHFNQRQLEETNQRHQAGQAALADTLHFEIRLQQATAARVDAQSDLDALLAALGALMALDQPAPEPDPPADHPPPDIPDFDTAWAQARQQLPDLLLAHANLDAAHADTRSLEGQRLPDISLFGEIEARREENPDFSDDDLGQTIGILLSYDLWDGNARRARIREAQANHRQARAALRQTQLDARTELREALIHLQAAHRQVEIQERTVELTHRNRELIESAHHAGAESLLRLNEAQRDHLNAQSRAAQARLRLRNAEIDFRRASGDL